MGCDIHMFAEKKNRQTNKWEQVVKVFKNPYHKPENENKVDEDGYEWNPVYTVHPYNGRNYNLFAILADVRNGRGFAGVKTGEGFIPIADPKGVPEDASEGYRKEVEEMGSDGHSHSWLTLKELQDYDWNQYTMLGGWVGYEDWIAKKLNDVEYSSWSGGISGSSIVHIEEEQAEEFLQNLKANTLW